MRRSAIAVVFLGLVTLLGACGRGGSDEVRIDSIEPSSATFGDEIVIRGRGFTAENNDIGFGLNGGQPSDEYDGTFKTGFIPRVASPDGKTLRFALEETLGACAYSRLDPEVPCVTIGLTISVGETQVAVFNRHGVSNAVPFTRTRTPVEAADEEVRNSPQYHQLTEDLDEWIDDYYHHPPDRSAVASYGYSIQQAEDGHVYIQLGLSFIDPNGPNIPEEIEGYPVQVSATWIRSE